MIHPVEHVKYFIVQGRRVSRTFLTRHNEGMSDFKKELKTLLNAHSRENVSDTPDFVLAEYMSDCLRAFEKASKARDKWHQWDDAGKRIEHAAAEPSTPQTTRTCTECLKPLSFGAVLDVCRECYEKLDEKVTSTDSDELDGA
jgi:hypothetical protein